MKAEAMTFDEWWKKRHEEKAQMPEEVQWIIERKTRLQMEYQGLMLTNVYDQDLDFQVQLNTRLVAIRKELAELEFRLNEYIYKERKV